MKNHLNNPSKFVLWLKYHMIKLELRYQFFFLVKILKILIGIYFIFFEVIKWVLVK